MQKQIFLSLTILLLLVFRIQAQLSFSERQDIPVEVNGAALGMPLAGGLNGVNISKADLNGNGTEDLVLFDKSAQKISTFLWENERWMYHPEYESAFPLVTSWLLMEDFNCDGKKDVFTSTAQGLLVYPNVSEESQKITFSVPFEVMTTTFSGNATPLKVDVTNLPAIADIDGDGDLDILTAVPSFGGSYEWHQNLSVENTGECGEFIFQKITNQWGGFRECGDCFTYLFDENESCSGNRVTHAGSSIFAHDLDGDGDLDLLLSEVTCSNLTALYNDGSAENPEFKRAETHFPESDPVTLPLFPAPYFEDVDGDGQEDLLISPNLSNSEGIADFKQSLYWYRNQGTATIPAFREIVEFDLQKQMIDLGEESRPASFDMDSDGDQDLFVSGIRINEEGNFENSVQVFENIGSNLAPEFRLIDTDFLGLSGWQASQLLMQFVDYNQDGTGDLVMAYSLNNSSQVKFQWVAGKQEAQEQVSFNLQDTLSFEVLLRPGDQPHLIGGSGGQSFELLIARWQGNLELWKRLGESWELESETLGGIERDFFHQFPGITVANINGNNHLDLVWGDWSGELVAYLDFQQQPETWEKEKLPFQNDFGTYLPHFGSRIYPAAFGKNLIIGNRSGGLKFVENNSELVNALPEEFGLENAIEVYPNPSRSSVWINSKVAAQLSIFSNTGKEVLAFSVEKNQASEVDLANIPAGVYFLKSRDHLLRGAKRIMITR